MENMKISDSCVEKKKYNLILIIVIKDIKKKTKRGRVEKCILKDARRM